jgi:hypothetical protein
MRAADYSWEAPPSPVRTKSAAPLLLLIDCVTNVTPFPQKSQTLAFISREDASPKASTHRSYQSLTRFTLIYPSCSVFLFGNDRANCDIWTTRLAFPKNCALRSKKVCAQTDTSLTKLYTFGTTPTVQTNEYQSVYGSAFRSSSMSEAVL